MRSVISTPATKQRAKDTRPASAPQENGSAELMRLKTAAGSAPSVLSLKALQTASEQKSGLSPGAFQQGQVLQRVLAGDVEGINQSYLRIHFVEMFPQLKSFSLRQTVLEQLKAPGVTYSTKTDIENGLRGILGDPVAGEKSAEEAPPAPSKAASEDETSLAPPVKPAKPAKPKNKGKMPDNAPSKPVVISTAPARAAPSRALKPLAKEKGEARPDAEPSHESDRVTGLYEEGLLLVTSIQPDDLKSMHNADANEKVSAHVGDGKIEMTPDDLTGDLAYAKANWALAGPRMRPQYFGMMDSTKGVWNPKPEKKASLFGPSIGKKKVGGARIATLADPSAFGTRFMRGKDGHENLDEWEQDQDSSKTAGVEPDAPLYPFEGLVEDKLNEIKVQQEEDHGLTNPEINTFGFPPEAVIGFLVTSASESYLGHVEAAKSAMSAEQQERSFPVFTWTKVAEGRWSLILLAYV